MKRLLAMAVLGLMGCARAGEAPAPTISASLPSWTWDSTLVFPGDGSLARPEDGVALPDGRLIVADQVLGLRVVNPDGSSSQFGDLPGAGYTHRPPTHPGGANGVSLEPGGTHLLVADVFGAAIYRVDVATGATERLYQHRYGINTAVRDASGAIWFTQSARNTPEEGEPRLWASVEVARPEGALYRLQFEAGTAGAAQLMADSLLFANGIAIDSAAGQLYLAETTGGRVLRFRVDVAAGTLGERTVFVDSVAADNLELDGAGNLWIAVPLANELLVVNTATGERHSAFRVHSTEQAALVAEFTRRGQAGEPRMELFTPALWAPFPAPITGIIVGPSGPVYATGLGNALLRLPR